MKNKLWVFGCSLSTGFGGHAYHIDYNNTWPKILADKLELELDNSAHAGQCNWVSILQFIDKRDEIQKGDIVVFEFTFFDRYNIYPTRAQLIDLESFFIQHKHDLNEVAQQYKDINFKWFGKQVYNWCKENQIPIYLWSTEGKIHSDFNRYLELYEFIPAPNNDQYSFYYLWQDDTPEQHIINSNGDVDKHFNELGHKRMANHIFEHIYIKQII